MPLMFCLPIKVQVFQKLKHIDFQEGFIINGYGEGMDSFTPFIFLTFLCCFVFPFYLMGNLISSKVPQSIVTLFSLPVNLFLSENKKKCNMANEPGRQQYEELYPVKTEKHYLRKWLPSIDWDNPFHLMNHLKQFPLLQQHLVLTSNVPPKQALCHQWSPQQLDHFQ